MSLTGKGICYRTSLWNPNWQYTANKKDAPKGVTANIPDMLTYSNTSIAYPVKKYNQAQAFVGLVRSINNSTTGYEERDIQADQAKQRRSL